MSTTRFCSIVNQFSNMYSSNRYYGLENTSLWNLHLKKKKPYCWHSKYTIPTKCPIAYHPVGILPIVPIFLCCNANFIQNLYQCNNSVIMNRITTNIYASSNSYVAEACVKFCGDMFLVISVRRKHIFFKFEMVSVRQVLSCFKLPSHSH